MDGNVPGQIGMRHTEVASPHIRELIGEESSMEDDIGDDANSAILAEKAIRYVGKLILGRPLSKSQSQLHCDSQAE